MAFKSSTRIGGSGTYSDKFGDELKDVMFGDGIEGEEVIGVPLGDEIVKLHPDVGGTQDEVEDEVSDLLREMGIE